MDSSDVVVEVRRPDLTRVGQLVASDLTDFLCVPRANAVGSWSVKLPATYLTEAGAEVPHELCAVLRQPASGIVVTGPNGVILSGPMSFASQAQSADDPPGTWTIEGVSDAIVLGRGQAYPNPAIVSPQASSQSRATDYRTAAAETLMLAFVAANIGPVAPAARRATRLTMATNLGRGPTLTKSPRFQNLLELLQEIATGSGLLFDVVQVGDSLEFRVSVRLDVSASARWDVENNQLSSVKYAFTGPQVTHVIVAGKGEATARKIIEVTTTASLAAAAIWGRSERFVDQRNTDDDAELLQAGLEVLADEGAVITSLEIVPSSDMADGLGSAWLLGSWVTVVVGDQEIRAPITEVPISITSEGLLVGATVGDPVGFEWESMLSARQSQTESRVSALERN